MMLNVLKAGVAFLNDVKTHHTLTALLACTASARGGCPRAYGGASALFSS
jgi:hypothetical protein